MLALIPGDAPAEAIGALPDGVRTSSLDDPARARAEFCVLDPRDRETFAKLLPDLGALRVVQTLNAGVDWVPALPPGVTLCNASGVHDGPVAEWIIAMILALNRDLPRYHDLQRKGQWDQRGNTAHTAGRGCADLGEQCVLIIGHGSIGRALQARLTPFGTQVLGVAAHARSGVTGPAQLPELVPRADVVVLLTPATEATRGLVDRAFLARMRAGALLINAARGALVDTTALLAALVEGRIRAALDCTDPEPLPLGHPLWQAPGVLITPHVAGSSEHWRRRAYRLVGDQLRRYASGEPLVNVRRHGY